MTSPMATSERTSLTKITFSITQLYWAYVITQFGSYLMLIPAGKTLAQFMDLGVAWAILLIAKTAGYLFLPRLYARLAYRFGSSRVIQVSQVLACLAAAVTVAGYFLANPFALVAGIFLECCFSIAFLVLFPAILNRIGSEISEVKNFLANMVMVEYLAFIFARAAGGVLNEKVSFYWFVIADAGTFILAAILWFVYGKKIAVGETAPEKAITSREYGAYFFKPFNAFQCLKKIYYGILNPFFPALIITFFHGDDSQLALFYIVAGFGMVVGSHLAKKMPCSKKGAFLLTLGELMLLGVALAMPNLYWMLATLFVSLIMAGIADVFVQTLFMGSIEKARSPEASAVFNSTYRTSMLTGFGIFILLSEWAVPLFMVGLTLGVLVLSFTLYALLDRRVLPAALMSERSSS